MVTYEDLSDRIADHLSGDGPHIVGIAGAVAAGKSTMARELAVVFGARGRRVDVVATDAFLYPNPVLAERDLTMRKGFPESFDLASLVSFLEAVRDGTESIDVPVYSHTVYDILPGEVSTVVDPDLVIVEGVIGLHEKIGPLVHVSLYIDAAEDDVKGWFVRRFLALTEQARRGEESFYRMFAAMDDNEVRSIAEGAWGTINAVNLHEHIAPSRRRADIVVEKTRDHSIVKIGPPS